MSTFRLLGWRTRFVVSGLFALVVGWSATTTWAQDASPPRQVDEQLYLLRALEHACYIWPQDEGDPQAYAEALRGYRNDLIRLRTYIQQQPRLDPRLAERFDALIGLIDAHRQLLAQVTGVQLDKDAEALQDHLASGGNALANGIATGDPIAGSIVASGTYLLDSLNRSEQRDHAAQVQIQAAIQVYDDQVAVFLHECTLLAQSMTRQHGWGRGEAGWTDNDARDELVETLIAEGNVAGLIQIAEEEAHRRPRDPFAAYGLYSLMAMASAESAEVLMECATNLERATGLVPEDTVYDDVRLGLLVSAAEAGLGARSLEYTDHVSLDSSSPISRLTVDMCERMIPLAENDSTGAFRNLLAIALLCDGQLDAADTQSQAVAALQQHEPYWQLLRAAIDGRRGRFDQALLGVKNAISSGMIDPMEVWDEPHFRPLIAARPDALHTLLDPRWAWQVSNDLVWDDVTFTNGCFYPLTNVTLTVDLRKGPSTTRLILEADLIPAGHTHTWTDVVDGPYGKWDAASSASLTCDQVPDQP